MGKVTKKERLFELFDQKKRTNDPEVKAIARKSGTRHHYFQEWKKLNELKGGKVEETKTDAGTQATNAEKKTGTLDEVDVLKQENEALNQENETLRQQLASKQEPEEVEGGQEIGEKHPEIIWSGTSVALKSEVTLPIEAWSYFNMVRALGFEPDNKDKNLQVLFDMWVWNCILARLLKDYGIQIIAVDVKPKPKEG